MRYASVCDGIGAAHAAWGPLGWECAWTSEVDPFPADVVKQRYGHDNLGDMLSITERQINERGTIDLLAGGTPCQSFSIANTKRQGLGDHRGNLALQFVQLAGYCKPKWIVWENVPGVLSCNNGHDFGTFLKGLVDCGYSLAYRVMDAQHYGVPQRRRRVFVVGSLGGWRSAAAVLLEQQSVQRNPKKSAKPWQEIAIPTEGSVGSSSEARGVIAPEVSDTITQRYSKGTRSRDGLVVCPEVANCLTRRMYKGINTTLDEGQTPIVMPHAYTKKHRAASADDYESWEASEVAPTLNVFDTGDTRATTVIPKETGVRRLTPRECERLQGFPDDHTAIVFNGKQASDTRRYKALGNSWAVPVAQWIGRRIEMVEEVNKCHTSEA